MNNIGLVLFDELTVSLLIATRAASRELERARPCGILESTSAQPSSVAPSLRSPPDSANPMLELESHGWHLKLAAFSDSFALQPGLRPKLSQYAEAPL